MNWLPWQGHGRHDQLSNHKQEAEEESRRAELVRDQVEKLWPVVRAEAREVQAVLSQNGFAKSFWEAMSARRT